MNRILSTFIVATTATIAAAQTDAGQLPMKLWYNQPAQYFEESLPIGNGKLGALVYGGTDKNTIYLNDITLWTGKPVDPNEDAGASKWIPEIRKALFNEDYKLADSLQLHVQGHNSQFFKPLATLYITDLNNGEISNYYRELSLDNATVNDSYQRAGNKYEREYFASNPDKVIAMRIVAKGEAKINCRIDITSQVPHKVKASEGEQLTMTGYAGGDHNESTHFCSILKVETKEGTTYAKDSTITIAGAKVAYIYFVNETSYNGADKHPVSEAADYLANAVDDAWHLVNYDYFSLLKRHKEDYQKIFNRFNLYLGGSTFNKDMPTDQQLKLYTDNDGGNPYLETLYAQYGRYLLISSSRTPGVPANLQGLWSPHLWSPWRGNYTVNINLEENYWPAEVANMGEMTMPLEKFIGYLAKNGANTARNYYGIEKGWCSSHNSDIWAMTNPVGEKSEKPEWANWNMGGAWLVNTLWEHYQFSMDRQYLRDKAYPLMKGATEFMLEWLIDNPNKPGELITAPSTSPENEYVTDKGYHGMTCYGGTADLAIIRELLTNTAAAAKALGVDKQLQKQISSALAKLHPYTIGKRGNLQEWYYDWDDYDWQHRHQSHLIGLYPGSHLTDPTLLAACNKSLEIKGDQTTGWSTGWRINLWARLHNAKQAYHIYQKLLTYVSPDKYTGPDKRRSGGTYPNLFDAHPPFQIDGNFGGTAGVCEMLVQSDNGKIELLPALPQQWASGKVCGICARGGIEIAMEWKDGKVVEATLKPSVSTTATLLYNGKITKVKLKAGKSVTIK